MAKTSKLILGCLILIANLFWATSSGWGETKFATTNLVTINLSPGGTTTWLQMSFSNDNQTWSAPEPFASSKVGWDLTAYGGGTEDGIKCIYVKLQDSNGNWSASYSGCLILDTSSPTGAINIIL